MDLMDFETSSKFLIHVILTAIFAALVHLTFIYLRVHSLSELVNFSQGWVYRILETLQLTGFELQDDGILVLFLFVTTVTTSFIALSYKASRVGLGILVTLLLLSLYSLVSSCVFGGLFCLKNNTDVTSSYIWLSGIVSVPNLIVGSSIDPGDRAKAFWIVCGIAILTMWGTWILLS